MTLRNIYLKLAFISLCWKSVVRILHHDYGLELRFISLLHEFRLTYCSCSLSRIKIWILKKACAE